MLYYPSIDTQNRIRGTEGFRPTPYLDPKGNTTGKYSTGFGHQIQPNEQYLMKTVLSRPAAEALYQKDLSNVAAAINPLFKRAPTPAVYNGIFDLGFNAGPGNAAKVISTWNATGDTTQTANHLNEYVVSNGKRDQDLVERREYYANLITGNVAAATLENAITDLKKKADS